jgi:hypothetical protein
MPKFDFQRNFAGGTNVLLPDLQNCLPVDAPFEVGFGEDVERMWWGWGKIQVIKP